MTDSLEGSSTRPGTREIRSSRQGTTSTAADPQEAGHGRIDHREDSISGSESHSSDDGIEWEGSGHDSSEYASEDDRNDSNTDEGEYDGSDGEYGDTRRLLANSSRTRVGGMGMGMRVGETGTGTTIGLDFEQSSRHREDYNVLPLANVGGNIMGRGPTRSKGRRSLREATDGRRERSPRRSIRKDRRRSLHATAVPVIGLGGLATEQERLIAKRQVRIKTLWNVFYVLAWYVCVACCESRQRWKPSLTM